MSRGLPTESAGRVRLIASAPLARLRGLTVSLPGFLETGSQQAMTIAILTAGGYAAGQVLGFGFGSKVTTTGLNVVLALIAARIMIGPLHLRSRIAASLHRDKPAESDRALQLPADERESAAQVAVG